MKPLYTQEEFNLSKTKDLLPCKCYICEQTFFKNKKTILASYKDNNISVKYCSTKCSNFSRKTKQNINCNNCGINFEKTPTEIKKSKSGKHFCSNSCSASYNNKNKTTGNRRSKLEIWLEEQLTQFYPDLPIDFNKKSAIGSELDIYIPSLNLGIELNGIFHYEPIYGTNKLDQIQSNDKSKSLACHEAKIDLCIIDTSGQTYVKPSTSQKYLDIIINIINERLLL
jgi:hypothetical protein